MSKDVKKIDDKRIERMIPYKIHYDRKTKKVGGLAPYYMVVANPDQPMPKLAVHPPTLEEREAVLVIYKKKGK